MLLLLPDFVCIVPLQFIEELNCVAQSHANNQPQISQDIEIMICWMNERKLIPKGKYTIRHTSQTTRCIIKEIKYKIDINSLHRMEQENDLEINVGRISIL